MNRYLFVLLALTACATPEQDARKRAAYADGLRNQCAAYGFQRDTPQMAQCVMQLDQRNRQAAAANSAATFQQGIGMMQSAGPRPATPANAPVTTCFQNGLGGVECR